MQKKVVILGSRGMAGHMIVEYLRGLKEYEVTGIARSVGTHTDIVLDVLNDYELHAVLKRLSPDIVVNCVGLLVTESNEDVVAAIHTNALLPHKLAELGKQLGYRLIHLSTDCVFSGRDGEYTEISPKDGLDNYAKTKALGEICNNEDLTIRTSIIGPELDRNGSGLLNWFLKQNGEIYGYVNAYWTGVTTLELAKVIDAMIKQKITGLYHLCPSEKISKYDLLNLFKKVWNSSVIINAFDDYYVDKSLISTRNDFDYNLLDYETMLQELKEWIESHYQFYADFQ